MRIAAFLLTGLLLTCAAMAQEKRPVLKPKIDQAALDKLGWRLSSQAYTFRSLTLFETIDLLSDLGIGVIEMYPGQRYSPDKPDVKADHNMPPELVEALIVKLKEKNVKPVLYGVVGLPNDEAQQRKVFDYAKKLGMETIVSEPPLESIELIDKLANEYEIDVAIHDHPKPSLYWNPDAVLKACEGRSKRIGACADIGHWRRSDLVPVDCVRKLEGKIISLHVKDIDEKKEDVVWGTGLVDVKAVLVELKRQGAKPVFSIEYEKGSGDELVANVSKCIEYFSSVATELAK